MAHLSRKLCILGLLAAAPLVAQQRERIQSPEAHEDRTVTFRLKAPDAQQVQLQAGWLGDPRPMEKNEEGLWSVTVGPLEPQIYDYTYLIDGVRTIDPHNPEIKLWAGGHASLVAIPADEPRFYDFKDVPHGDLHTHWYESSVVDRPRQMVVYTPPGYQDEPERRYPTLYLLHGAGDNQRAWTDVGRANLILDNLIASGEIEPMLVVMPSGHPLPYRELTREQFLRNEELFREELIQNVLPMVHRRYRAILDRDSRAVAGLSMGGGQTLEAGLGRLDLFAWIGAFSSAVFNPGEDEGIQWVINHPESANQRISLLWIAIGEDDFLLDANKQLHSLLDEHGVEHEFSITAGGHSWPVWRDYLRDFLPRLFR